MGSYIVLHCCTCIVVTFCRVVALHDQCCNRAPEATAVRRAQSKGDLSSRNPTRTSPFMQRVQRIVYMFRRTCRSQPFWQCCKHAPAASSTSSSSCGHQRLLSHYAPLPAYARPLPPTICKMAFSMSYWPMYGEARCRSGTSFGAGARASTPGRWWCDAHSPSPKRCHCPSHTICYDFLSFGVRSTLLEGAGRYGGMAGLPRRYPKRGYCVRAPKERTLCSHAQVCLLLMQCSRTSHVEGFADAMRGIPAHNTSRMRRFKQSLDARPSLQPSSAISPLGFVFDFVEISVGQLPCKAVHPCSCSARSAHQLATRHLKGPSWHVALGSPSTPRMRDLLTVYGVPEVGETLCAQWLKASTR